MSVKRHHDLPARGAIEHGPAVRPLGVAGGSTVLVVDDDDEVRDVIVELLTDASLRVLQANRADEAWSMFTAHPEVDVVLTDVMMPGETGTSLARRLRRARPSLPVVLISGHLGETADASSAMAVLAKPFTRRDLLAVIADALAAGSDLEAQEG